ncbi:MAG: sigma-54 dependent transcriptional regulator [SAR324 cluster bacterium]|nr:sigma-54 dependent transcriptional regulator [SAR324 cluster bacterium]
MEKAQIEILVLDDEASIRWVIEKTLADTGHGLHFAESAEQAEALMNSQPIDLALVDINLPGDDGFSFLQSQQARYPDLLVAVVTGQASMDNAVTAMKLGAFDYLTKPFDIDEIESLVGRAAQAIRAGRQQPASGRRQEPAAAAQDLIIGKSHAVREIYKSIGRVAETDISVLIQGESGTGKELIARSVHHHSGRTGQPFVAVNCAAIPRELLEAELFGHEKGAFTGATERKAGKLEASRAGSVFLDEIGDMPLELQAKLLRVLQEREFQRVGGLHSLRLESRVLAASNRGLLEAVEAGAFRADLYYRLSQFTIEAPPLRERREDIPVLVEHFLLTSAAKLGLPQRSLTSEAMARMSAYGWPGNVRELENVIKSLMIMVRTSVINLSDLPRAIAGPEGAEDPGEQFEQLVLQHWDLLIREHCEGGKSGLLPRLEAHLERPLIRQVLHLTGGNQLRASAILGINRNTLRSKMQALGIRKPQGSRRGRQARKVSHGAAS